MWSIQSLSVVAALTAIGAFGTALGSLVLGLGLAAMLAAPVLGVVSLASGVGAAVLALREAR